MSLLIVLIPILVASGALELALYQLYTSRRSDRYKLYPLRPKQLGRIARVVIPNSLLSGAILIGVSLWGLDGPLIHEQGTSAGALLYDVLATLGLYDLLYYCLHRFLFHEWRLLRSVHVVHHTVKYPSAIESLFVHPIENVLGVSLLLACLAIVGPVSLPAYAIILASYSWLNIVIHSGLALRSPLLRPVAFMIRKHARHHSSMRSGNYASITPLPDLLFRTFE
ncbi:MAG: sterol desaturase family protein [Nannocystaceae bacterium]